MLGINNLILPSDTYFRSGAFTITVFVIQAVVIADTIVDFLDIAGTNGVTFELTSTTTTRLSSYACRYSSNCNSSYMYYHE